jgi:hypothetical protein
LKSKRFVHTNHGRAAASDARHWRRVGGVYFRFAQPVPLQGLHEVTLPVDWDLTRPVPLQEAHLRAGCATSTLPVPPQLVQDVSLPRTWVLTRPVPLQKAQVSGA